MGKIYHYDGAAPASRVLLRGGSWGSGSGAGAFGLHLNLSTGDAYYDVGFRCAR
jgi:formylglycine-generating enzyme required for sulfatase activity